VPAVPLAREQYDGVSGRRTRRPHVLLLAFQFPPGRGSGVYRIRAWANHLVRNGCEVTVLTVAKSFYEDLTGVDAELEATVDPRVKVAHVRFPHEQLRTDVPTFNRLHATFPELHARVWQRVSNAFFPEQYGHLLPAFVARGLALHARRRVDVVLATGNPFAQHGAAWRLGRLLRRPYAVDFHDSWTLNQFTEADAFPAEHPAWAWERRIVDGAAIVMTVNSPLRDWYAQRYPTARAKLRIVENGFADDVVSEPAFEPVAADRPLRFGFVGTIRPDLPLEPFLDGWRLARATPELAGATCDFYGYLGYFDSATRHITGRLAGAEDDGVRYRGPVPQTRLTTLYGELDALAMPVPSARYVTAGKVYDYMASGRPIVAVHEPRNHSTEALAPYPLKFPVGSVTAADVCAALVAAGTAARDQTRQQFDEARAVALRHTWDAHLAPVAAELRQVADHG
jgi:glycosyltransferase involved in cell wall biosynthesis